MRLAGGAGEDYSRAMMDWTSLLSTRRLGESVGTPVDPARSPFQKDMDRIVFSAAFRRLQDKTQVHSFPQSDFVRTRLTHSMEVASVGRSLGAAAGQHVVQKYDLGTAFSAAEFGHIVAAACLAHDIGNPPFGHFGETYIRRFFAEDDLGREMIAPLSEARRQDFLRFEGNAQGFRILTKLQNWQNEGGLRLTAATMATFSKYPRAAFIGPHAAPDADAGGRKFGFFQAERDLFAAIAAEVGLIRRAPDADYWCRHPLTFLVEAADDICYHIVDLEDGFKLGRIAFAEAEELLHDLTGGSLNRYGDIEDRAQKIAYLRAKAIGHLVERTADCFIACESDLLAGKPHKPLLELTDQWPGLQRIATLTAERIFQTHDWLEQKHEASRAISRLLGRYCEAFLEHELATAGGKTPSRHARQLLKQFDGRRIDFTNRYQWLLAVTDYVSGMTDSFALAQYRDVALPLS